MQQKPRILVVGAGPAGLSAAVHLLEQAGSDVQVELVSMGHHLGGKAASWRDQSGYSVDHGFHAVFGFYEQMRALAKRAGVDLKTALISNRGVSRFFSTESNTTHELRLSRNGLVSLARMADFPEMTSADRRAMADASVRMARTLSRLGSLELIDDVCFKAFVLEHGAPASFLRHPLFRQVHELAFNHPFEISAYIVLRAVELMGHCFDDASYSYVAGGISEKFWDPIAAYFTRLGGTLRVRQKLVALEHRGGRLTGATFGIPDNVGFHRDGQLPWLNQVPIADGTEFKETFDALICTLPPACFCELNEGDSLWEQPFFKNLRQLSSVSTLSLQVWLERPLRKPFAGTISGLQLPLSYALDYKQMVPEFKRDTRYGAALEWVGAEAGYEELSDEELIRGAREGLARVPGYERAAEGMPVHTALRRNRANHQRYLLTDPGTLRFRPTSRTPIEKLFLAGDWVRNEIDVPTMEGAIRSGKVAAALALGVL